VRLLTDFLVIGSGVAGQRAALSLAEVGQVVILSKAHPRESNTGYAQGGIAAAVGPDDSPELHARDTIAAGDGLCDPQAVHALVSDGPRYVSELMEWGAAFDRDADGRPALGREAAHSVRRVLHARDATGREIGRVLWGRVRVHPSVRVFEDALALWLDLEDGACVGATFVGENGIPSTIRASRTLIATGGAGHLFRETTNPLVASGDGMAMAFDAGARVADLEFVQFHPTVLSVAGAPRFLLSEALRGEGGRLLNARGEAFVQRVDPAGDLAPRDVVARAIALEIARTGAPVYLSMQHLDAGFIHARFPTISAACRDGGLDLARDLIPVSPAAHYMMGGVETDLHGRTSVPSLFAAGEVASTGVHGANRLASNSLLEGLVFGARAAQAMQAPARPAVLTASEAPLLRLERSGAASLPTAAQVQEVMWQYVGLSRTEAGLLDARARLEEWSRGASLARDQHPFDPELHRVASLVTVGLLVTHAALRRQESRGGHFRADFPRRDDLHWSKRVADARVGGSDVNANNAKSEFTMQNSDF
jgi:L-aspartate oxidase